MARFSRPRLSVEILEDRNLLSTLSVVPGTLADKVTSFSSLAAAVGAAKAGDTIQIETGSTPGATTITQNNLTIQGDPASTPATLPQAGTLAIAAGVTGVTLTNLNLSAVTIANGSNHIQITRSVVQQLDESGSGAGNGFNLLSGDTITGTVNLAGNAPGTPSNDQVLNNAFTNNASSTPYLVIQHDDGVLVQGNTFTSSGTGAAAIEVYDSQGVQVTSNIVQLNGGTGILIESLAADTSATVAQNHIDTGTQGTGIFAEKGTAGHTVSVVITGNDLNANRVGIVVCGDGTRLGTTDAGGGGTSTGGNLFTTFSTTAGGRSAIYTMNASSGTVSAFGNTWDGNRPEHAIYATPGTSIQVSNLSDARYVFVQALYNDFLKRDASLEELNPWVAALPGLGLAGIANLLIHSPEALAHQVDGLYQQYLGRPVDPSGAAGWVNFLAHGGTEEQVINGLVTSAEFQNHLAALVKTPISPDADFIQGLYQALLHRTASSGEVNLWLGALPGWGRTGVVNLFLASAEYRGLEVQSFYSLLHRAEAPAGAEVLAWVNSGVDLLTMQTLIAGSAEFYNNG